MQHDQEQIHFEELAEVLKAANDRRSTDLGGWLKQFIRRRRVEGMPRAVRSAEWPSNQAKA
jgi:hypothetical protein